MSGLSVYNNADQLVEENGVTYTYDLNGNLKTKTDATGTTAYTWDYEDRLVKVAGPGGTVTYEYDVDGNRVSSTTAAGTTRYLVDTNRALAQVLAEYTPAGTVTASYVYADDLICMTRGGQTRWYHFDGLGSTRLLTDETGAITDTYSYDAFGNLIARTGTTQNDFLFTGQQRDANAGWYYLRARWMDPAAGRFTSMDPFEGVGADPMSLHKYIYARVDPVDRVDPKGLFFGGLTELAVTSSIQNILVSVQSTVGFAIMDQVRYGGDAGIKNLIMGVGILVGGVVAVRVIGGLIRRAPLLLQSGSIGRVIPTRYLEAHEVAQAERFVRFRGGTFQGPPMRKFPGIDGTLVEEGIPISLKGTTTGGGSVSSVWDKALNAERQALNAGYTGVEVVIDARKIKAGRVLEFAQQVGLGEMPRRGVISAINVETADGWLRLVR